MNGDRSDDVVATLLQKVSAALLADAESLSTAITDRLPELAAERAIAQELVVSTRANILRFLRAAAAPESTIDLSVPPEALDLARVLVRRGATGVF